MWLSQAQITSLLKHNKNTRSKGRLVQNLNFYSLSIPQLTESVVSILDDVSDWPEDVVQEHSSAYVFNHHLQYYFVVYTSKSTGTVIELLTYSS